jgi:hypothetical protein
VNSFKKQGFWAANRGFLFRRVKRNPVSDTGAKFTMASPNKSEPKKWILRAFSVSFLAIYNLDAS